jgi:hypothetical protein
LLNSYLAKMNKLLKTKWLASGKKYFFSVLFILLLFTSCQSKEKEIKDTTSYELEDYYEFQGFDLASYDIPATIMLPDETANIGASIKPEVEHIKDDFYWNIYAGQNFHLYIEDYGENTNLVKEQKQKLKNTQFYDVKYLVDEPDLIIYEVTLKVRGHANAAKTVGVKHVSYHVYSEQVIDGIHYEMRSRDEGFDLKYIELIAKSIRSIKSKSAQA